MAKQPDRTADLGGADPERENQGGFGIPEHLRFNHGPDGAVVLDILHGQMFRLNFVASRILEMLKQNSAESAIAEQLAREFGIDRDLADADVLAFLETLKKHNLLTTLAN